MSESITQLRNRLTAARDKSELLRLRENIAALMDSPQFQQLSQRDGNRVEDLPVETIAKEEQFKWCDPRKTMLEHLTPQDVIVSLKRTNLENEEDRLCLSMSTK